MVTGTSAVGIKYKSSSVTWYIWPSLSGSAPVPNIDSAFTTDGGRYSSYPALIFWSKKKEINALCNLAPFPLKTGKPAPVILLPRLKSIKSYNSVSSQWGLELSLSLGISPTSSTTSLSFSELPLGTLVCGLLGISNKISLISSWI